MATRGRPTLFQTTKHIKTLRETYSTDTTDRTSKNRFYAQVAVDNLIEPNRDTIPGADRLEKARGCLEQLGRMVEADIAPAIILKQAQIVAEYLSSGGKVKTAEEYLRVGRRHKGEWFNPAILKDDSETDNRKQATDRDFFTPGEYLAIMGMLRRYHDILAKYDFKDEDFDYSQITNGIIKTQEDHKEFSLYYVHEIYKKLYGEEL